MPIPETLFAESIDANRQLKETVVAKVGEYDTKVSALDTLARSRLDQHQTEITAWKQSTDVKIAGLSIDGSITLEVGVGKQFSSIQTAFDSLAGKQIKGNVLINVADGVYETNVIYLQDQTYSSKIRIEGNLTTPENCVIKFIPDGYGKSHGIIIRGLYGITIGGFKFIGQDTAEHLTYRSIYIDRNSRVEFNPESVVIEGGVYGIQCYSSVFKANGLKITSCSEQAIIIDKSSVADLLSTTIVGLGKNLLTNGRRSRGVTVSGSSSCVMDSTSINDVYIGMHVSGPSYLQCNKSIVSDAVYGFYSAADSFLWAHINDNIPSKAIRCDYGFLSNRDGSIYAPGAIAENCLIKGFSSYASSYIFCDDAAAISCAIGFESNVSSLLQADRTSVASTGNTTVYSPSVSGVAGNTNSILTWS